MSSASQVLKIARSQIGVKENPAGSNKVKYNNEYYGRVVSGDNYDWCAVFVWWVFKEAGCSELFFGGKKSAYCPSIADYYIAKGQTVGKNEGKAGDIVLFDFNDNGTSDHIGIIEKKNSDGTYTTIEGNTGGNGQVMRKTRYKSDINHICRPKYNSKGSAKKKMVVYLSPSRHGVGNNKCLKSGCYEDKHTRPIAEECAKHLKASGLVPVIADKNKSLSARCKESDNLGAVLYVPIHTNASDDEDTRYLMFMALKESGEHLKMMQTVAPYVKAVYPATKKVVYDARPDLDEISDPKAMTLYCELGFHTNDKDVKEFIHKPEMVGKALAQGICKRLGVKFKEAGKSEDTTTSAKKEETTKTDKLKVDGDWGKDTTKKTQKVLGSVIDGIVSKQLISCKKYLPNVMESSWDFVKESQGGSAMIKALQELVGAKQDGEAGGETVEKMQKFLKNKGFYKGKIDKSMGEQTVKGWQEYINSRLEKK